MKLISCFLLSAVWLLAQQQPSKPEDLCSVEGQVTSVVTGAPVRKAEITLRGVNRAASGMPANYTGIADAGGNFTIKDVEPGKYRLSAQRTGFAGVQYGARGPNRAGATLSLSRGQRLKDLSLRLSPQAVITGRVVDENNDPMLSAQVRSLRYTYQMGRKQLAPWGYATTNDLGEYRLYGLTAGRYYLMAAENHDNWEATVDASANPTRDANVTTYYPGTADPSAAVPIEAGTGVQLRGVNITLARGRTVRIHGRVEGHRDANIQFHRRGQQMWMDVDEQSRTADQKGNFEILGLTPGTYTLTAIAWSDRKTLSALQEIEVGEHDIDNIVLVLASGAELKGRIEVESGTPPDFNSVSVMLQPQEGQMMFSRLSDRVHDGAFTIGDVAPDIYHVEISGLPDGFWVKSIRMGDQEVKVDGIDLTHGPGDALTIVVAPNAGQVDGAVIDNQQKPAAGATVVLVPEPKLRAFQEAYKVTTADESGHFSLKNIEPGEYKLFAWEDVEYGAYMDPEVLGPVEDRGQVISIQENGHATLQLTVIPGDSAPAVQKDGQK